MSTMQTIKTDLKTKLPAELVEALLAHYAEIKEKFYLDKHEPSELNGGKFAEICFRILQCETASGAYTPIGQQIPQLAQELRKFEQIPTTNAIASYRINIPRTLTLMCDIRNNRGVAHPGVDISPNHPDASLVTSCADWVLAELFRIHYQCSPDEAQSIVDTLVQRRLVLVQEVGDVKRVLLPSLEPKNKILLLLYTEHPGKVLEPDLLDWLEVKTKDKTKNRTRYLEVLHHERLIEYRQSEWCLILSPGVRYVEAHYQSWLDELNKEI